MILIPNEEGQHEENNEEEFRVHSTKWHNATDKILNFWGRHEPLLWNVMWNGWFALGVPLVSSDCEVCFEEHKRHRNPKP